MNVIIPQHLQKRVQKHARNFDITEQEYIRTALESALRDDEDLASEMRVWESASLHDFNTFARTRKI